jgi:hypothetical protein
MAIATRTVITATTPTANHMGGLSSFLKVFPVSRGLVRPSDYPALIVRDFQLDETQRSDVRSSADAAD